MATGLYRLRGSFRRLRPRPIFGVHTVALTPEGRIVLVRLRYAPGWRLPGGGRGPGEDSLDAVLRELREEIGLISHGRIDQADQRMDVPDFGPGEAALFVVRDVVYRPRWSLEVEAVTEAPLSGLPADMSPRAQRWLERVAPLLA